MRGLALLLFSYLLGSVSFSYIVGRVFKGVDIRTLGDGNAGAANIFRHIGAGACSLTLIGDILKGAVAVLVAQRFDSSCFFVFLCGIAVVVGHVFPICLGFRGGRGVAAVIGVFFAFMPVIVLILLLASIIVALKTKNTGLAISILFVGVLISAFATGRYLTGGYFISLAVLLWVVSLWADRGLSSEAQKESRHL